MKPAKRPQAVQVAFATKAAAVTASNKNRAKATALINTPGLLEGGDEAPAAALPAREHRKHVHAPRGPPCVHLLDKREVLAIANVSFPTIWGWMRQGAFPRSRIVGGKSMWLSTEIESWLTNLPIRKLKGDPVERAAQQESTV